MYVLKLVTHTITKTRLECYTFGYTIVFECTMVILIGNLQTILRVSCLNQIKCKEESSYFPTFSPFVLPANRLTRTTTYLTSNKRPIKPQT